MAYTLIFTTDIGAESIYMDGLFIPYECQEDITDLINYLERDDIREINCVMQDGKIVWVNELKIQMSLF